MNDDKRRLPSGGSKPNWRTFAVLRLSLKAWWGSVLSRVGTSWAEKGRALRLEAERELQALREAGRG